LADTLDRLVPTGTLGLAVSGGPDSLALLLLAAEVRPGQVEAATVDHGLRPESAGEAALVAGVCDGLLVTHDILHVTVELGASLQAQAREARYAALGRWAAERGLSAIATAHHADDQAETLMMRLARGSGVGGLAGVRECRTLTGGVSLVRPLLGWRKGELQAIVEAAGLPFIDDPANADARHDRTHVRALLSGNPVFDPVRLARSASALAEADEALDWTAARERAEAVSVEGEGILYRSSAPAEIKRRVVLGLLQELAPGASVRGPDLDRLLEALKRGETATLAGVLARAERGGWSFRPAPPRRT
jgi:tRNA(Ile)-lysidine synthase